MPHPAACLLVWGVFAVAVQFYGWPMLLAAASALPLLRRGIFGRWLRQLRRAKWLFLSLWIILAYGIPGELWRGLALAPSIEGMEAATLHAARLIVLFGSIAALFELLPHDRFVTGLWHLARPLQRAGWQIEHSVARLALVFDYLEQAPPRGSWRHFLDWSPADGVVRETISVPLLAWRRRDTAWLAMAALVLPLVGLVP